MGPRCWHLQELLLRPREEGQGFPHPWNRRHRPCRSPQRQARRCPEAAWHWAPARHWTSQAQRLPTEEGEPEVLGRHLHQARRLQGVCADNINDKYFARVKAEKSKKEGDIFEAKKEAYKPSEQRKADQAAIDAQVLSAIKGHADGAVLRQYLKATFSLSKGEFPHKMCFYMFPQPCALTLSPALENRIIN